MPRVKPLATDKGKEANKQMLLVINNYLFIRGMSKLDLAKRIGMPESTFRHRWASPDNFRRGELTLIFRVLQVSDEDKKKIPW